MPSIYSFEIILSSRNPLNFDNCLRMKPKNECLKKIHVKNLICTLLKKLKFCNSSCLALILLERVLYMLYISRIRTQIRLFVCFSISLCIFLLINGRFEAISFILYLFNSKYFLCPKYIPRFISGGELLVFLLMRWPWVDRNSTKIYFSYLKCWFLIKNTYAVLEWLIELSVRSKCINEFFKISVAVNELYIYIKE